MTWNRVNNASEKRLMNPSNRQQREEPVGKLTLKTALLITSISLILLVLDALLSFWGQGWWITAGGVLGMVGLCGLAQALVIVVFTRRG